MWICQGVTSGCCIGWSLLVYQGAIAELVPMHGVAAHMTDRRRLALSSS